MRHFKDHLINIQSSVRDALARLDLLAGDAIVFLTDDNDKLIGSLTDGDIRRGLLKGYTLETPLAEFTQQHPRFLRRGEYSVEEVIDLRSKAFKVIPVLDKDDRIIYVINFRFQQSYLPVDALIMAGGRGERMKPLTDQIPKPMLKVGSKPIIEYNVDRMIRFGIDDIYISLRYLGEQIQAYFGGGEGKGGRIRYVWESDPLGTIGAASLIDSWEHNTVLVMNSDLLTTIDFEDFYLDFIKKGADMSVATIPYHVDIPYAVLKTSENEVISLQEKPTYTYYSNGGIYLIKREIMERIPDGKPLNATDLMQQLIADGLKLISYPIRGYWLDIGRMEDFNKAQADIQHIKFID